MRDIRGLHRWLILPFLWNSQQRKIQSQELGVWCCEGLLLSFSHGHTLGLGVICSLQSHGPIVFRRCGCHALLDLITGLSHLCRHHPAPVRYFSVAVIKKINKKVSWGRERKGVYFVAIPEEIRCIMPEIMWQWEYPHTGKQRWRTGSGFQL